MTRAIYQMDLQGTLNDVPVMNTLHWVTDQTECTFTEAGEIAEMFVTSGLSDMYLDCLSDNYTLEAIRVRGIVVELETDPVTYDSPVACPAFVTFGGAGSGHRAGTILSNMAGPLISIIPTILAGERARVLKNFLPGVNEADADDDLIVVGLRGALTTYVAGLLAGMAVSSGHVTLLGIIRKKVTLADLSVYVYKLARAIITVGIEYFVASQRNRRPKLV